MTIQASIDALTEDLQAIDLRQKAQEMVRRGNFSILPAQLEPLPLSIQRDGQLARRLHDRAQGRPRAMQYEYVLDDKLPVAADGEHGWTAKWNWNLWYKNIAYRDLSRRMARQCNTRALAWRKQRQHERDLASQPTVTPLLALPAPQTVAVPLLPAPAYLALPAPRADYRRADRRDQERARHALNEHLYQLLADDPQAGVWRDGLGLRIGPRFMCHTLKLSSAGVTIVSPRGHHWRYAVRLTDQQLTSALADATARLAGAERYRLIADIRSTLAAGYTRISHHRACELDVYADGRRVLTLVAMGDRTYLRRYNPARGDTYTCAPTLLDLINQSTEALRLVTQESEPCLATASR